MSYSLKDLLKSSDDAPSSEERFDKISAPNKAYFIFKEASDKLAEETQLAINLVTSANEIPELTQEYQSKYGPHELRDAKERLFNGEKLKVVLAQIRKKTVGYGIISHKQNAFFQSKPGIHLDFEILDVDTSMRRGADVAKVICVEGQEFQVGISHILVSAFMEESEKATILVDATTPASRYVFKSLGFTGYNDENPCLLKWSK